MRLLTSCAQMLLAQCSSYRQALWEGPVGGEAGVWLVAMEKA